MIEKYTIILANTIGQLAELVNVFIQDGWEPFGIVTDLGELVETLPDGSKINKWGIIQPMVKRKSPNA